LQGSELLSSRGYPWSILRLPRLRLPWLRLSGIWRVLPRCHQFRANLLALSLALLLLLLHPVLLLVLLILLSLELRTLGLLSLLGGSGRGLRPRLRAGPVAENAREEAGRLSAALLPGSCTCLWRRNLAGASGSERPA